MTLSESRLVHLFQLQNELNHSIDNLIDNKTNIKQVVFLFELL